MLPLLALLAITESPLLADSARVSPWPVEQRLELDLNPATPAWSGTLLAKLDVPAPARRIRLQLHGPVVSRVEMTDAEGRVELAWGADTAGALLIETNRPLAPGTAWLDVGFGGPWSMASPGVARDSAASRAWLERGEGVAFPAWPGGPATRWTLLVHAPSGFEARASGRLAERSEARGWRSWTFRTSRPVRGDALRVSVRRAPPAAP